MTSAPSERQVLYAIVAGAWMIVVGLLAAFAWWTGVSSAGWSLAFAAVWGSTVAVGVRHWRRTGPVVASSLLVFVFWVVGTLIVR